MRYYLERPSLLILYSSGYDNCKTQLLHQQQTPRRTSLPASVCAKVLVTLSVPSSPLLLLPLLHRATRGDGICNTLSIQYTAVTYAE